MAKIRAAILFHYRRARRHQMDTYGMDGLYIDGVHQRQHTGGGAPYGEHAISAYLSAKRSKFFHEQHRPKAKPRKGSSK